MTIQEADKVDLTDVTLFKKSPTNNVLRLHLEHSDGEYSETVVLYHEQATKGYDSEYDAVQRAQWIERNGNWVGHTTISSESSESDIDNNADTFVINTLPFIDGDTINLVLEGLNKGSYLLNLTENSLQENAYFVDKTTGESISVSDLNNFRINISTIDTKIADRYAIVSKKADITEVGDLNENPLTLSVFPNPSDGKKNNI